MRMSIHVLEFRASGLLSIACDVLRDGQPLTRTSTLYSPVTTSFSVAGRNWSTGIHIPGGRRVDVLREMAVGAFGRGCFALSEQGAQPTAVARERGMFKGGYALSADGDTAQLRWDATASCFHYEGAGGSGRCERRSGMRGVVATLPAALPAEQQVFIGLLALRRWVNFTNVC